MTPTDLLRLTRFALGLGCTVLLVLMLGPFAGLAATLGVSDFAAHLLAAYLLTAGLFAVAPRHRRGDLAAVAVGLGGLVEAAQGVVGRDVSLTDMIGHLVGVGGVYLPGFVEHFRYQARRNPLLTWREIQSEDPRRSARGRNAPGVLRRLFARPWTERTVDQDVGG